MKELTIEEKARAYDDAILKLRDMMPNWERLSYNGKTFLQDLIHIFPALKESEDDRIMKEIIYHIQNCDDTIDEETESKMIAWLEEQGDKDKLIKELSEYKVKYTQEVLEKHINSMSNKDNERLRKTTIAFLKYFADKGYENAVECIDWLEKQESVREIVERCKNSWYNEGKIQGQIEGLSDDEKYQQGWHDALEKQSEQKSSTEVEPKFKIEEGKWYVCTQTYTLRGKIVVIKGQTYKSNQDGAIEGKDGHLFIDKVDGKALNYFKPWTINDAKDGDVLTDSSCIFIIKKLNHDHSAEIYCCLHDDGDFDVISALVFDDTITYPATKEQRNLLFQKIKEAGYMWDPITLKLNKEVIEDKKESSNEQKLSKEDKERIQRIYAFLWKNRKGDTDTIYQIEKDAEWLKNLNAKYNNLIK